jgi:hypothetical protein
LEKWTLRQKRHVVDIELHGWVGEEKEGHVVIEGELG